MPSDEVGLIVVVAGLGFWLAFIQTARHLPINLGAEEGRTSNCAYRSWQNLAHCAGSSMVGAFGLYFYVASCRYRPRDWIRSAGKEGIYSLQPIMGTIGAGTEQQVGFSGSHMGNCGRWEHIGMRPNQPLQRTAPRCALRSR